MTGAAYRWTASFGLFTGTVTTLLTGITILNPSLLDRERCVDVWFFGSALGILVSMLSQLLYSDQPDRESLLNRRSAAFIALALNFWPWILLATALFGSLSAYFSGRDR